MQGFGQAEDFWGGIGDVFTTGLERGVDVLGDVAPSLIYHELGVAPPAPVRTTAPSPGLFAGGNMGMLVLLGLGAVLLFSMSGRRR